MHHSLDCEFKGHGRMNTTEIALYKVKDAKIIKAAF
ncbi:MAG: SnoaL-like domain-containing protein [Chitinophagaceae bacterium]